MDLQLKGLVALVTGGSRGIGRSIALELAREGCPVSICARSSADLSAAEEELKGIGGPVFAMEADVTDEEDMRRFVDGTANSLGGIDLVILNAGSGFGRDFEEATKEDWIKTFDINVFQTPVTLKPALPHLRKSASASVLLISSVSGMKPMAFSSPYCAAKAAQIHLVECLAQELARDKIRVNAVSPGSTHFEGGSWDRFKNDNPETYESFQKSEFPFGRLGTPEEIANVSVFLSSPKANWINGVNVPVSGGQRDPAPD